MSKKLLFLVFSVFLLGFVLSNTSQAADPDLLVWYKFDDGVGDTATDSSGNGNDGAITGATWVGGQLDGALDFGGDGDQVEDADGELYLNGLNALTVSMWIKSRQINTDRGFIIGVPPAGQDRYITMRYDSAGASGGGDDVLKMGVSTTTSSGDGPQLESSEGLQTTDWQHVCMTWESGGLIYFYVNGVEDTPTDRNNENEVGDTAGCSTLLIGRGGKDDGTPDGWDGLIDDVRIYSRVLTLAEIQDVMLGRGGSQASEPIPADGAVDVLVDTDLSWKRGEYAIQDDVYLGTDPCMANLPKVATLFDFQDPLVDLPVDLIASTTYYWYVAETDSNTTHTPDGTWQFTTVLGEATPDFPPDGAVIPGAPIGDDLYTTLDFFPGATNVKWTGYFSEDYAEVSGRAQDANLGDPPYGGYRYYAGLYAVPPAVESLVRGTIYYWTVDSEDALGNMFPGDVWEFIVQSYYAYIPNPPNEAIFVPSDVLLSWNPGFGVVEHDIYMGTEYEAVRDARYDFNVPGGTAYVGPDEYIITRPEPNYMVTGLPYLTKHYWRVDEVNGRLPPPFGGGNYYIGSVWNFTTQDALTGLAGEYYHHTGGASPAGFEAKMLVRVDPEINFDWLTGSPDPTMAIDNFSVRWTGRIAVPVVGNYTFTTETDDGARLWINDTLIIDQWVDQGVTPHSGSIQLNSYGPHDIKMEYYENGGGAAAKLYWEGPMVPYGIVPSNYLAPNFAAFTAANPSPRYGSLEPDWQPTLSWTPGAFAATHELYFSSDFDDVNERTAPKIVLTALNYTPPAPLDLDQTYYWAIDEVNSVGPAPGFWPGDVWNFTLPPGGTGRAVREWWLGIGGGTSIPDLTGNARYPDNPDDWEYVDIFEGPTDWANNYGSRIHGWLRPPTTGDYRFWIATDDNGELWLSTSEDPADANLVSEVTAWANPRDWDDTDVVPSGPITLQANKKYYIMGLMKEGGGGDNIAAAWQGPSTSPVSSRQVIDGQYLCATPYDPPYASNPRPQDGATEDDRTPLLSWWPGAHAQAVNGHELYFSSNYDDVNDRTVSKIVLTEPNYPYPTPLMLGQTYYWAIDEVNSLGPVPGRWSGKLWSFTMNECISLDNFEDYNDRGELRVIWEDGYANVVWGGTYPFQYVVQSGSSGSNLNVSSAVGNPTGGGTGPIRPTGLDAMVLRYDNDGWTYTGLPGAEEWVYDAPYFSEIEAVTVG
ncbi:MAG: PA14 domain-containing protein, partial [Planctomycetota bacterium]